MMKNCGFFLLLVLLVAACEHKRLVPVQSEVEGDLVLELIFPQVQGMGMSPGVKAIVNGKNCPVKQKDGKWYVGAERSEDGNYDLIFPSSAYSKLSKCFVLAPAQSLAEDTGADAMFFPAVGHISTDAAQAQVNMIPVTAYAAVNVKGSDAVRTIWLENNDGLPLCGTWSLQGTNLLSVPSEPMLPFVSLNAGQNGLDAGCYILSVPAGRHSSLLLRVTDVYHHCGTLKLGVTEFKTGAVTDLGTVDFSKTRDIRFAEHFDACVWGGDPVKGRGGYGPDIGESTRAARSRGYRDAAYYPKQSGVAGTELFKTADWSGRVWDLSDHFLRPAGLLDFFELYYMCAYQGYIGGDPAMQFANRPVLGLPRNMDISVPSTCDLSFRICSQSDLGCDIEVFAGKSSIVGMAVDDKALDIGLSGTSPYVSQSASKYYLTLLLRPDLIGDGKWHDVRVRLQACGRSASIGIRPSHVRGVNNIFYVDDIVVTDVECDVNRFLRETTQVEPTTSKGDGSEDISGIRLMPTFASGITNLDFYEICPEMGITWICGGLPSDERLWASQVDCGLELLEAGGGRVKLWCSHLPYGDRSAVRDRDLCVPDPDLHAKSVAFYKRAIRAIAPMHPMNVLIHCNQTLLFNDGSSEEMMIRSLAEIAPVADSIGAHLVVENMSYGVGADAEVLSRCIDRANALAKPVHEIRIGMDTGHANLYLSTVGDKGDIIDWLRTAGTRVGQLHVNGNRGLKNVVRPDGITCYDDHLYPGYDNGITPFFDRIGRSGLWGKFYAVLLGECLYRGPFVFEVGNKEVLVNGETRSDHTLSPWSIVACHDNYIYPEFRQYLGK